jgi:PKD domain
VPNQGPRASLFISPARKRAKKAVTFRAAGSRDPDGEIATYAWDFGDGVTLEGGQATRFHRYRAPGEYLVTLTVTDDEGCSTKLVYAGQTASCNGSQLAVASSTITVGDTAGPILRLGGAKAQRVGGRVVVRARCPREFCSIRARSTLVTTLDRDGTVKRQRRRLGGAQALRPSRSWRKLRLRLPRRARRAALRALALGGEAKANVVVVARDEDNELKLKKRKVELLLP